MTIEENTMSLSGTPIYRYPNGENEWKTPKGEDCLEQISDHIERHIGKIDQVFHEMVSDTVHIDIHHVLPTEEKPYHTLITSGMSDLAMTTPKEIEVPKYLELMVTLPKNWKVDSESFKNENWYWPIRQLKYLARFPHKFETWLGWGHTMPNGEPAEAFADNTKLSGVIILPSVMVPSEFYNLPIDDEKTIEFYGVFPLYKEEMKLKLSKGSDTLLDKFDRYRLNDIIEINRKNVAKKRFGLF